MNGSASLDLDSERTAKYIILGLALLLGLLVLAGGLVVFRLLTTSPCGAWGQAHTLTHNSLPLQLKWQYQAPDPIVFPPHVIDGMVFVKTMRSDCIGSNTSEDQLSALDARTGQKLWDISYIGLQNDVGPIVSQQVVIAAINTERTLRGVDQQTGKTRWEIGPLPPYDSFIALAQDDHTIYAASGPQPVIVYAIEPRTGNVIWSQSDQFTSRGLRTLLIHNGALDVVFDENIFVLDLKTGDLIRTVAIALGMYNTPTLQDSLMFVTLEQRIEAVDLDTLRVRWQFSPACIQDPKLNEGPVRGGRYFLYAPSPVGDAVYTTGGCRTIFALDSGTGKEKWAYDGKGIGTISYVVAIGKVGYVMFSDWSVRALDLTTGQERGRLETTAPPHTFWGANLQGLATQDGMLYATFLDKTVYAFGP